METLIINSDSKKDLLIIKEIALKFGMKIQTAPKVKVKVVKKTPNATTLRAMQAAENKTGLTKTKSHKDMMDKLFG